MNKPTSLLRIYIIIAIFSILFTACEKKNATTLNNTQPTASITPVQLGSLFDKYGPQLQTFAINTEKLPTTIYLKEGTKVTISPGTFRQKGIAVTGVVSLNVIEVLTKSNMVLSGTNTLLLSNGYDILESAGYLYLDATLDNTPLDNTVSHYLHIEMPVKTNITSTDLFWGINAEGRFSWAPVADSNKGAYRKEDYLVFDWGHFGWVNCDRIDYSMDRTNITATINNLSAATTNYIIFVFKGRNIVLPLVADNTVTDKFKSLTNLPVGAAGKLIGISTKADKFYFAQNDITITKDGEYTLNYNESSQEQIQAEIKKLDGY